MKRTLVLLIFVFFSCEESYLPKQKAYLAHQFDKPLYKQTLSDCDYKFLINQKSKIKYNSNCNAVINYSFLKADIFISNLKINNNLELIKKDFDLKVQENTNSVSTINISEFNDQQKNLSAVSFAFVGNAPSNIQFYVTDSKSNFLIGSLYFNIKPNYDSLLPSISYIKNDIRKIIESISWN
ncbi:MAG: hypothetical protein ACJ0OB_00380 [Flavobacteriaceae bacterium]